MDKPHITLIGMGLIGSSIGHALKRGDLASHITGYARSATTRQKALSIGFVDSIADSLQQAVADADIVFLNVPVGMIADIVKDMAASLKPGAIVTDVGSVKKSVMDAVQAHLPENTTFVPAHPIAGTELSGPEAGFAELFDNRWCIITPDAETDKQAVKTVSDLFMPISGEIIEFNESLETNPEKVNEDPYGEGWMIKVKISNPSELDELLSSEEYSSSVG